MVSCTLDSRTSCIGAGVERFENLEDDSYGSHEVVLVHAKAGLDME